MNQLLNSKLCHQSYFHLYASVVDNGFFQLFPSVGELSHLHKTDAMNCDAEQVKDMGESCASVKLVI